MTHTIENQWSLSNFSTINQTKSRPIHLAPIVWFVDLTWISSHHRSLCFALWEYGLFLSFLLHMPAEAVSLRLHFFNWRFFARRKAAYDLYLVHRVNHLCTPREANRLKNLKQSLTTFTPDQIISRYYPRPFYRHAETKLILRRLFSSLFSSAAAVLLCACKKMLLKIKFCKLSDKLLNFKIHF